MRLEVNQVHPLVMFYKTLVTNVQNTKTVNKCSYFLTVCVSNMSLRVTEPTLFHIMYTTCDVGIQHLLSFNKLTVYFEIDRKHFRH